MYNVTLYFSGAPEGTIPSGYIVCAWCQKPGVKLFTLRTGNGTKAFCSELCFTQCRRASFKKNKICDWCKHVRHTVNYVDFQDGDSQLQFCSAKCLNQYKMNIFCRETQEHLQKIKGQVDTVNPSDDNAEQEILITPDLWLKDGKKEKKDKIRKNTDDTEEDENMDISARIPTVIKCELKTENQKCTSPSPSHDSDKTNTPNRSAMEHLSRERHRRHSSKESPRAHVPVSSSSDMSPQSMHASLLSNGIHPMAQWIPPQFWGSFAPTGMPPMGAYPPWFYPGFMPPLPGMMHPGLGMEPGLVRSPSVPLSTPNRSALSPGSDSRSSTSTPNQHKQLTPRQSTPGVNSEPKSPRQQTSPNPSFMSFPSVGMPPFMAGDPRLIGSGLPNQPPNGEGVVPGAPPPLTMVMPVPIPLPVPIPIPLPLPITMEKILEVFGKQSDMSKKVKKEHSSERTRHKIDNHNYRHKIERDSKDNQFMAIHKSDINENETVPKDRVSCVSCHSERSTSVGSCPELSASSPLSERRSSILEYVSNKRSLTPQTDGSLDLSKKSRVERAPEYDGAIDLSKDSLTERYKNSPGKENRDGNDSDISHSETVTENGDDDTTSKVPKIHIISPRMDPPLSQQMPLPPADPKYSSRRGLILDAPCVQNKRQRSPSPDRRSYVRAVPRDIMEAARRRCMRARIRTK